MGKRKKGGVRHRNHQKMVEHLLRFAEIEALKGSPGDIRRTKLYATEKQFSLDEESKTRIFRRWVRAGINGLEPESAKFRSGLA